MTELPPSPGSNTQTHTTTRPEELNADLATAAMAKELVKQLGRPSIITKAFAVRKGICEAMNHSDDNQTGYDTTLRVMVYDAVENASVNIDGKYFERTWAYLMHPKFIIQGMPMNSGQQEEQPNAAVRFVNWIRGNKGASQQGAQ